MKCIIFATDENIVKRSSGSSRFQDLIMMNLSYCDEYIIIGNASLREELFMQADEISEISYRVMEVENEEKMKSLKKAFEECGEEKYYIVADNNPLADYGFLGRQYKECMLGAIKNLKLNKVSRISVDGSNGERQSVCYVFDKDVLLNNEKDENSTSFSDEIAKSDDSSSDFDDEELYITSAKNDKLGKDDNNNLTKAEKEMPPMIKLSPAFKDYLWGGTKLKEKFGKESDLDIVAESWELSAHPDGRSKVVRNSDDMADMYFDELTAKAGKEILGWKCRYMSDFPILIKFIDAKNPLSIQVHPNDDYALMYEDEYGKNEMWYILEAEEGAGIYCGFNRETSKEEVIKKIEDNTILEILNRVPAKKGDVFFIKAGTVHAIGAGIMICEIQQSSNCTYRLYDYDRKDKFGNKRELHIDKALDVLNFSKYEGQNIKDSEKNVNGNIEKRLACCKYFNCVGYTVKKKMEIEISEKSFKSLICVDGFGKIRMEGEEIEFKKGDSIFIAAGKKKAYVDGECELVITEV